MVGGENHIERECGTAEELLLALVFEISGQQYSATRVSDLQDDTVAVVGGTVEIVGGVPHTDQNVRVQDQMVTGNNQFDRGSRP